MHTHRLVNSVHPHRYSPYPAPFMTEGRGRAPRARVDEATATWAAFLRAHAAVVRRLEADLATTQGLALAWYDVLLELEHAPERRLRMQELGERAVLSRSRVSRIVDELEVAGFVRREPDPADRRGTSAVLTTAGRNRLRRAAPAYLRGIDVHLGQRLTGAELTTLRRACEKLLPP